MTTKEYLELAYTISPDDVDSMEKLRAYNKELLKEYPFLKIEDSQFDDLYTLADDIPHGWRLAFGDNLLKELREALIKNNALESYYIYEIKEKWGRLAWYDAYPYDSDVGKVIDKYEDLSSITCINCGKPAKYITTGWICPYCEDCISEEDIETAKKLF